MNVFFSLLSVWLGLPVSFNDDSVSKDIELLGHPQYHVRQKADNNLRKKDVPLRYLSKLSKTHPDMEVCRRLELIVRDSKEIHCKNNEGLHEVYTLVSEFDPKKNSVESVAKPMWQLPSIWWLPNEVRFPFGFTRGEVPYEFETTFDLSRFYYEKARDELKFKDCNSWRVSEIELRAAHLLLADLRMSGWKNDNCVSLMKRMLEVNLKHDNYSIMNPESEGECDDTIIPGPYSERD